LNSAEKFGFSFPAPSLGITNARCYRKNQQVYNCNSRELCCFDVHQSSFQIDVVVKAIIAVRFSILTDIHYLIQFYIYISALIYYSNRRQNTMNLLRI